MKRGAYLFVCAYVLVLIFAAAKAHTAASLTRHERDVIRFFQHHPKLAATAAGGRALARILPDVARALQSASPRSIIPDGVCASCWDNVAACESGDNWSEVTGNGYYWGLQWVPSTWDSTAARHGLPSWKWYQDHRSAPSREQQILAASDMALSNWPVCGARY